MIRKLSGSIDWILFLSIIPIILGGLATMTSFDSTTGYMTKQLLWILLGCVIMFLIARSDVRFLRNSKYVAMAYAFSVLLLVLVLFFGKTIKGSRSWFSFGEFSLQPIDTVKLFIILILAKYFSRRHVEIVQIKHLFISSLYALVPVGLVLLQPDFGSAVIAGALWLGMALVSGISKKHIAIVFSIGIVVFSITWFTVFKPYQKARIINFINPTADIRGSGYNAYQSMIAVGSGGILGKGFGYGTQSRLNFLPENQTDFVFAAFAEEWGFLGALIIIISFGVFLWRIILHARRGATNFETLFCIGYAVLIFGHVMVNIGMNIGIMPVTGIPLPFMSYGGSHIIGEFIGLGIILSMSSYERSIHPEDVHNEFLGYA